MKLLNLFKSFKNDEAGAVTVDWVVLTAAIVGLGLVVMTTIRPGITGAANVIQSSGATFGRPNNMNSTSIAYPRMGELVIRYSF